MIVWMNAPVAISSSQPDNTNENECLRMRSINPMVDLLEPTNLLAGVQTIQFYWSESKNDAKL